MRLLIVEDEVKLNRILSKRLKQYNVKAVEQKCSMLIQYMAAAHLR